MLADLGADVIKIENLTGDTWRNYLATSKTEWTPAENPLWEMYNMNKRTVSLNLREAEGKEVLLKLLAEADVFITNNHPRALKAMGIDYDSIKEKFPSLVYALVTAYGQEGPDRNDPGFDAVAFWGRTGMLIDLAEPNGNPVTTSSSIGDCITGMALFGGICSALYSRSRTEKGDFVEVSLYGTAIWSCATMMALTEDVYGNSYPKTRTDGCPYSSSYRSKDGVWFIITILDYNRFFKPLCEVMGAPELAQDPRYKDAAGAMAHRKELFAEFDRIFGSFDFAEVEKRLKSVDLVFNRMRHFSEMSKDPQAFANDFVREFSFDSGRSFVTALPPIHSRNSGASESKRAGHLGEHTATVLKELGYSDEKIEDMAKDRVIRT